MSDVTVSKEEKFREARPLTVDAMTLCVDLKVQTIDITTHTANGEAYLLIEEARELRDWLNKVLP